MKILNIQIDDLPFERITIAALERKSPWIQYWADSAGKVIFTINYSTRLIAYCGQFVSFTKLSKAYIDDLISQMIEQYNIRTTFISST